MKRGKKKSEKFEIPTVRGERVKILGKRPENFKGLGHTVPGANILVLYPGGEKGVVRKADIEEG
jgi:ATP-dependent Zn protease